jgi:hypothetical protein
MIGVTTLYSQAVAKTPYQQKISSLFKKLLMDIGFDYATAEKASTDNNYARSIEPKINQKIESGNSLRNLGLINQFKQDCDDAKKLMNDKEKEEDRKLEIKKEKIVEDSVKSFEYQHSDAYNLKKDIHDKYIKWSVKGEFEKTDDYQKRIANEKDTIKEIITQSLQEYIKYTNIFHLDCIVGEYNPDNETLNLSLKNKKGAEWKGSIMLSPDKAKQIKAGLHSGYLDGILTHFTDALEVMPDKCNLAFYNNNIISTKIKIKVRINDGGGNKHYEYVDVKMTSEPMPINNGTNFFNATNLGVPDVENFSFDEINLVCKQTINN